MEREYCNDPRMFPDSLIKILCISSALPGILFLTVYMAVVHFLGDHCSLSLYQAKESVAQIVSSYSFTFLGFILTIASILFSLSPSFNRKRFEIRGYIKAYKYLLSMTALYLVFSFLLSLLLLSDSAISVWILRVLIVFVVNSVVLVGVDFFIIFNLSLNK